MNARRFLLRVLLVGLWAFWQASSVHADPPPRVRTGVEVWMDAHFGSLRGKKIALITNETGVLPDLRHEAEVLARSPDIKLVALLGPEHGLRGAAQAGQAGGPATDPRTGLPVLDTYGKSGQALADLMAGAGADAFVYDIQDVGSRFYTYIWTLYDCMEAAARLGKPFVVLDRPNPILGTVVQGPVLRAEYASFVGRQAIAERHGLTVGELARLYNGEFLPQKGRAVALEVVPMVGWSRAIWYEDTGLPWVPPSPNMPTVDTALVYPGLGLVEGSNLSEGRGTTRPFEIVGAPWLDGRLRDTLSGLRLPGVAFRELSFRPTFGKFKDQMIGGLQIHVTDRQAFDPIRTALALLVQARRLYPHEFAWIRSEGKSGPSYWIDKLTGSDRVRTMIDAGRSETEIVKAYQDELGRFVALRKKYLLYPERAR